jgi:hypothetical protein
MNNRQANKIYVSYELNYRKSTMTRMRIKLERIRRKIGIYDFGCETVSAEKLNRIQNRIREGDVVVTKSGMRIRVLETCSLPLPLRMWMLNRTKQLLYKS